MKIFEKVLALLYIVVFLSLQIHLIRSLDPQALAFAALLAGYVFSDLWEVLTSKWLYTDGGQHIRKWHFHHSLFGLISWAIALLGLFTSQINSAGLFFWGLGVLVQHIMGWKKITFIDKD